MAETADEQANFAAYPAASRVLLVDSDPATGRLLKTAVETAGYAFDQVATGAKALTQFEKCRPAVVLLDLQLPDISAKDVLHAASSFGNALPVIAVTTAATLDVAVSAMRDGAVDFIAKPLAPSRVLNAVANALDQGSSAPKPQAAQHRRTGETGNRLVGASLPMQAVYDQVGRVAPSKASVFLTGESGTGKDMVAQAIHAASARPGPFVALNCGAIPKDLMESELFGHVKGAFTGASSNRMGAARRAHGGTLFLDEIGEMEINLQSKLLRFIQTGDVQPVGGNETHRVDVRFICATNRDPKDAVAAGLLREDLFYRLNVIDIEIPPLRERGDDIMAIARHFLEQFAAEEGKVFGGFTPDAEETLQAHGWPGNVRELQNVIRKVVVLYEGGLVTQDMLPPSVIQNAMPARLRRAARELAGADDILPLWMVEKEAIETAIAACGGNIVMAAARLGINPSTIYRKRQSWARGAQAAE